MRLLILRILQVYPQTHLYMFIRQWSSLYSCTHVPVMKIPEMLNLLSYN